MIQILGPKEPQNPDAIITVSRSKTWSRGLSPFFLGPLECYDGLVAQNMENLWQYSKAYACHVDANGDPTDDYFRWRDYGWAKKTADRYPAGKGAKPEYSLWGRLKYTYPKARKHIYIPNYAKAVVKTEAYRKLKAIYEENGSVILWDFDGYDHHKLGYSFQNVMDDLSRKCGHAFVLSMLLTGVLGEDGRFLKEPAEAS
jgi:hypothetical protein